MPSSKSAIEVKNLVKNYGEIGQPGCKTALEDFHLTIKKGQIFGLLGPNGAGKSTFINILAGIVKKSSGQIKVADIDMDMQPIALRYKLGIVPQEITIDPFFTVRETLEIYAGYFGVKKKDRRSLEILTALGLADKADVKPRMLSGGMKRRLLIAKALVHNPEILILDEPTAGVDVELRSQLWSYVRKLNNEGMTILLTTHYLEEAQELCDEIAIINHGKVIAQDKTANLMRILDNKEIIITLDKPLKTLPKKLAKLDAELISADRILIKYKSKRDSIDSILKDLVSEKLAIKDISTKEADLEDIFRYLVQ
jgi:ABC-2 type transport system ATP-binding protein